MWKLLLTLLSLFYSSPTEWHSKYPREVLEPWGLRSWTSEFGKVEPWEPQTPAERTAAQKAIENKNKYGGDMKLRRGQLVGNSVSNKDYLWPKGKVSYVIHSSIPSEHHGLIHRAAEQYSKLTCMTFANRTKEKDYIIFQKLKNDYGCWSELGYIKSGAQTVHLDEGCYYIGTIVHEIGHAIGFWHEHQREDRDKFVTVNKTNIATGLEDQFEKTKPQDEIIYNAFDYTSIMIYGNNAFSKDPEKLKTMVAKNNMELTEPYNKPGLDNSDIERVKCMYCKKCKEIKPKP